jgi:hypothetical protein
LYDPAQSQVTYGEIRDMLTAFGTTHDVEQLRGRTEAALAVTNAEATLQEQRRNERLARNLEIVIGVLAIPPLASDVTSSLAISGAATATVR